MPGSNLTERELDRVDSKLESIDSKLDLLTLDIAERFADLQAKLGAHEQRDSFQFTAIRAASDIQSKRLKAMLGLMLVLAFSAGGITIPQLTKLAKNLLELIG